jgi:Undecaprenyl-phosphate glucose phosphotransferase
LLFGSLIALNLFRLWGVYKFDALLQPSASLRRVTLGWASVAVALIAIGFLTKYSDAYSRGWSAIWFVIAWTGLVSSRLVLYARSRTWIEEGRLSRNVAVIGLGPIARRLVDHFGEQTESGVCVVGIFDDDETQGAVRPPKSYAGRPVLGDLEALERFVRRHPLDTVIIAVPPTEEERLLAIAAKLKTLPVDVRLCAGLMGFHLPHAGLTHFGALPLLNVLDKPLTDWQSVLKDVEDRVASALILAMISPVMLGIAALIKFDSPGPVFFRQKRYGFNNRLIDVYKFRTMYNDRRDDNAEQLTQRNDPRITRIGAVLRKYSLDELPQFFNVVRGEMSIVGPRPHALSAKAAGRLYDEAVRDYASRHRVKPGITGWAQVNGWRGETETLEQIRKRVEYDLVYIEKWSLWLDIKIIWMTVLGGFTGKNAF